VELQIPPQTRFGLIDTVVNVDRLRPYKRRPPQLGYRFFRVDESFRAGTLAGLTRARSLNTWFIRDRNAVTHLPGLLPSYRASCEQSDSQHFKSLRRGVLRAFWDLKTENGVFSGQEAFLGLIFSFFSVGQTNGGGLPRFVPNKPMY
jgi:hypothetical protein